MFHGPNGMLAPMPPRMSHDMDPRIGDSPGIRAENTSPLTSQASAPSAVMITTWSGVSAWKAVKTSL